MRPPAAPCRPQRCPRSLMGAWRMARRQKSGRIHIHNRHGGAQGRDFQVKFEEIAKMTTLRPPQAASRATPLRKTVPKLGRRCVGHGPMSMWTNPADTRRARGSAIAIFSIVVSARPRERTTSASATGLNLLDLAALTHRSIHARNALEAAGPTGTGGSKLRSRFTRGRRRL